MPFDFEKEGRRIEKELHWAIQQEDRVNHEARKALREIEENRRSVSAEMEDLQQREEQLLGIIEGKIKPSAVDLPQEEAQDFKTKLRLRVKGVRGIAVDKARDDLVPVEERIERLRTRIRGLDSKAKALKDRTSETLGELGELQQAIRRHRGVLRHLRSEYESFSEMVALFGWYNPSELSRKSFQEIRLSTEILRAKRFSVQRRGEEIAQIEKEIDDIKKGLERTLGEAYEAAFIPVVLKEGKSPRGRRYLQNELAIGDINTMDLAGKIKRHKATSRKAERLSSVLLNHIVFVEESMRRIARLCELRLYTIRLRELARAYERAARQSLGAKCDLHRRIISGAGLCSKLKTLEADFRDGNADMENRKERVDGILDRFRSDL